MRKTIKSLLVVVSLLTILVAVFLFVAYRATQVEPDFYAQAMQADPVEQQIAGEELESRVLDLHNHARRDGRWTAVFTDVQINGWLAADLPEKFPRALPIGVKDPRVSLEQAVAHVGYRYESERLPSVVWLAVNVGLAEEDNMLAIRIMKARAGALPIPLKKWLDRITRGAHRAGIPLRWSQIDGDPVALVPIFIRHEELKHRQLVIERIELHDGEIVFAGRTESLSSTESLTNKVELAIYLSSSNVTFQH